MDEQGCLGCDAEIQGRILDRLVGLETIISREQVRQAISESQNLRRGTTEQQRL